MFPLNDFNFVACALATFSTAVAYNVSRRRGRNSSGGLAESDRAKESRLGFLKFHRRNSTASARSVSVAPSYTESDTGTEPPASECGTPLPCSELQLQQGREQEQQLESLPDAVSESEDGTLKRKRSPPPLASADTPPTKRRRSPPAGEERCDAAAVKVAESTPQVPSIDGMPAAAGVITATVIGAEGEVPGSAEVPAVAEQTLVVDGFTPPSAPAPPSVEWPPTANPTTPPASPQNLSAINSFIHPSTPGASWHTNAAPIVAARPSSAFSAFTGQRSAFASSLADVQKAPVWSTSTNTPASVFGETLSAFATSDPNPLASPIPSAATAQTVLTGEEDEEVETEIKGAKVFIKRGDRDFCEGILGNVKFLKHKETGAQRILFRREPVWKVTMSVRLRPIVRCSFDEEQGALRVTLKEPVTDTQHEQLVIYALKRGKASRSEFAEFAKAVAASAQVLQDQTRA